MPEFMDPDFLKLLNLLLVPPGDGVLTIHTQKKRKQILQNFLYKDAKDIKADWSNSLEKIQSMPVLLLGLCSDCGGGIQRGANWGPLFVRLAWLKSKGYLEHNILDIGDIPVIPHFLHDDYLNKNIIDKCREKLYISDYKLADKYKLPVSPLSIGEYLLELIYKNCPKQKILTLGGDHSVSYPLVKSLLIAKQHTHKIAVIHFDAHTDLLSERFGVDINFGSWAYHILPYL